MTLRISSSAAAMVFLAATLLSVRGAAAQDRYDQYDRYDGYEGGDRFEPSDRSERYTEDESDRVVVSPKDGWAALPDETTPPRERSRATVLEQIVMWAPNRLLDLLDVFRVDVGVGPAVGAVVRVTKHAQFGVRAPFPSSARVGIFGRDLPIQIEQESEYGFGPWYERSDDRPLCDDVLGAGVDVLLIGLHLGICPVALVDFLGGIVTLDPDDDDLRINSGE